MARRKRGRLTAILIVAVLVGAAFVALAALRAGPAPKITVQAELAAIGKRTPVLVRVSEPGRGLTRVRVELQQGERVDLLEERSYEARAPWEFWGPRTAEDSFTVEVGRELQNYLQEGKATVRVVADRASSWLRFPQPAVEALTLDVRLRPPPLQVLSTFTYVTQGGCEAVVYRVGESSIRDGVQAGDWFFPGSPLPGGTAQERFALFSAPYDLEDAGLMRLVAVDDVGNEGQAAFVDRFKSRPVQRDTIGLSDGFMERVVPAILSQTPELIDKGDLLENYLMINGQLRMRNADTLIEMSGTSKPEFLWTREFLQMRNAAATSSFADRRTYTYEGRAVDEQDHLGFDLASTARVQIEAANNGTVVLARYFGIYGNAVVIDHGYGLMSLYGHLSEIIVQEGQSVERGDTIGRSGRTGLAGGDHLHFTMLLHGLPVDPREWWDSHWIHDRLKLKLGTALPFDG
jgi:murein DD-endopeptidase MepM/ murein hydrolase activator NlpD